MRKNLITAVAFDNYRKKLSAINKTAFKLMHEYVLKHGYYADEDMIAYAYSLTSKYGEAAAELTCQMYDEMASYHMKSHKEKFIPPAEPAKTPSVNYFEKTLSLVAESAPTRIPASIEKAVKQTSADTLARNAIRDGAEWAWVPAGDTCAFCITLASNGWQRASNKMLRKGHAQHIHANCDCTFAVRFSDDVDVEGYDPDIYLDQYNKYGGDINAMRRVNYAKNKEVINAQKRMRYWQKKQTGGKNYIPYDPQSERDIKASAAYKKISNVYDADVIAKVSGLTEREVLEVKRHIFFQKHKLYDGYGILYPDYDIAVAWKRLQQGNPKPRDIILLKHELEEARAEREGNLTLSEAHSIAKKKYDWEKILIDELGERGEPDGIL